MSLFAIADLHLSINGDKPMDIFPGWDNYIERLSENWHYRVNEDDYVVIPGDISWAMGLSQAVEDFRFIHNLPGKKIILKGNHDYWWTTRKKIDEFLNNNGFSDISVVYNDAVIADKYIICGTRGWFFEEEKQAEQDKKIIDREALRLTSSIKYAKRIKENISDGVERKILCFMHYPPIFRDYKCDALLNVIKNENIKYLFYGHIHSHSIKNAVNGIYENINFQLISADALEFTPFLIDY